MQLLRLEVENEKKGENRDLIVAHQRLHFFIVPSLQLVESYHTLGSSPAVTLYIQHATSASSHTTTGRSSTERLAKVCVHALSVD